MATQSLQEIRHRSWDRYPPVWLVIAFVAVALVSTSYLVTHGHPAYEGGLYLEIVRQIQTHGYHLPVRIPYYTPGGIPFAYPPFMFYLLTVVVDVTHVDPVWLMEVLPGLVILAYLVPYYLLADELLPNRRQAGFATLFFGVAPPVLRWHLSSGGVVRAPAMLLTLVGAYTGLRLFRDGGPRWLLASTVLWSLVILSHPVYTTFFGWTYLLLFATHDRTLGGLVRGATVAVGGLTLTAPWWLLVASRHGFDVFLSASNSRSTLGGGIDRLVQQFVWPFTPLDAITPFYLLAFAGAVYALSRRRWFLAAWMASASYLIGKQRFTFVAGAMLAAMVVFEVLVPAARRLGTDLDTRRLAGLGMVALLTLGTTGVGVAFAGSGVQTSHGDSPAMPQTVHPTDRKAMEWAHANTAPTDDFVVMGDAAEWFPYYAKRPITVSPWGTEWTDHFREDVGRYLTLSKCQNLSCLEGEMYASGDDPAYLYVPTRTYTVRGEEFAPPRRLIAELVRSDRYDLQYENDGVMIFAIRGDGGHTDRTPRRTPTGVAAG